MALKITGLSIEDLVHPGETLKEMLESKGMTQKELAARINLTEKHVSQIISGIKPITVNTALKLENVFAVSATFWNNLQSKYDIEKGAILEANNITKEEEDLLYKIPYSNLASQGFIKKIQDKKEKVMQMRNFYGVSNLFNVPNTMKTQAFFRKSMYINSDPYAMAAWCKICELATNDIEIEEKFDIKLLENKVKEIKQLMFLSPNDFCSKLTNIMSSCGIAFAVVKSIPKAPVNGFIKNINGRMRLCLTLRNSYSDIFWFSLFHEIGHLLTLQECNVHRICDSSNEIDNEKKADEFANSVLLSSTEYHKFITIYKNRFTKENIRNFALQQKVLPGIVVGRLHHDGLIPESWHNDLRTRYKWAN